MKANPDLHGNVPDKAEVALLLIDFINDLEFPGGALLFESALAAARQTSALKEAVGERGWPTIYVNDNFGRWRSDFNAQVEHCLRAEVRGRPLAELLRPAREDYFVLKPKHSGFYSTTLQILLEHLGAKRLILAGVATNNCVLFTANDAYLRDFELFIPEDCAAAMDRADHVAALRQMRTVLKADTRAWRALGIWQRAGLAQHAPPAK
ncbi:MAG TPA: isochorismatase family cysteine hydrolase [Pirellulales bacterium]|nr:isochorismatase family cysteine hydrolase [Pirellulales bacterium]